MVSFGFDLCYQLFLDYSIFSIMQRAKFLKITFSLNFHIIMILPFLHQPTSNDKNAYLENIQGKNAELGNDMDVKNLGWVRTIVLS